MSTESTAIDIQIYWVYNLCQSRLRRFDLDIHIPGNGLFKQQKWARAQMHTHLQRVHKIADETESLNRNELHLIAFKESDAPPLTRQEAER